MHWMRERNHFLHLEAVQAFCMEQGPEEAELKGLWRQLCLPINEEVPVHPCSLHQVLCQSLLLWWWSTTRRIWCSPLEDISIQIWQVSIHIMKRIGTSGKDNGYSYTFRGFSMAPNRVFSELGSYSGLSPIFFFCTFFTFVLTGRSFTEWERLWALWPAQWPRHYCQMGMWQGGLSCGPHHRVYHYSWLHFSMK